jgi:ketosteroid isomerase-like protein
MSAEENKQLVMQGYQMFANKDVQGILNMCTDEVEWSSRELEDIPQTGTFHGKAGVADFFTKLAQSVELHLFRPDMVVAEGDNVVVCGTTKGEVRASGIPYDDKWVHVFTVKDGKLARMDGYYDSAALQAAFKPSLATSAIQTDTPLHH